MKERYKIAFVAQDGSVYEGEFEASHNDGDFYVNLRLKSIINSIMWKRTTINEALKAGEAE